MWRLDDERLQSWAVDHHWVPGTNLATCRGAEHICEAPPGPQCECGFWALWSPLHCLSIASIPMEPPWYAVGLIAGWGTVAIHGREGFRAERAAVRCLFTDWAGAAPVPRTGEGALARWSRLVLGSRLRLRGPWHGEPAPERLDLLRRIAGCYAVPLVSMRQAVEAQLLCEWGVHPAQVREAAAWAAAGGSDGV